MAARLVSPSAPGAGEGFGRRKTLVLLIVYQARTAPRLMDGGIGAG